jgi:hypothetical protein
MMICDVDGGVINRDSWSWIRGFSRSAKIQKSAKMYANGLGG